MSEEIKQRLIVIEHVAQGQKLLIYAILGNLASILLLALNGYIADLIAIAAMLMSLVGMFRIGAGMGYTTGAKIGLVVLMVVPLVNLITLLIINARATKTLRAAGFKVGLLGAKVPVNV